MIVRYKPTEQRRRTELLLSANNCTDLYLGLLSSNRPILRIAERRSKSSETWHDNGKTRSSAIAGRPCDAKACQG